MKNKSPKARSLSKWELIYTYYNGISDVKEVVARAKTETVFSSETNRKEVPQLKEELPISQSSSNEDVQETVVEPEIVIKKQSYEKMDSLLSKRPGVAVSL